MAKASADFKAALDASAIALIDNTPTREEMEGYAAELKAKVLRNMKLPLDIDIKDSEQFAQQVMANAAAALKITATGQDIQRWAATPINELSATLGLEELADTTMMATAQAGLETASQAYGETYKLFSLTDNVLADGQLDVMEAIQLGASAVSMASTLIASAAGGAMLGPYGAVAGVVLGAISYFTSSVARAKEAKAAAMEQIYSQMEVERQRVNTYNMQELKRYEAGVEVLWEAKDSAVSMIADNWAAYEQELGVRFGLRFFPNSSPPPRAGIKKQGSQGMNIPVMCNSPGGCPYFPEPTPARIKAVGYEKAFLEMVDQLATKGYWLFNPAKKIENQYVMEEQGFSAYYDRTLRAFSAFLSEGNFWAPKHSRDTSVLMKTYGHHLVDLYQTGRIPKLVLGQKTMLMGSDSRAYTAFSCTSVPQPTGVTKVTNNVMFAKGKYVYGDTSLVEKNFAEWQADAKKCINSTWESTSSGIKEKVSSRVGENNIQQVKKELYLGAERFWQDLNEALVKEQNAANVFKTRIAGDLIQTANAVGGELATSLRLHRLLSDSGSRNIQELASSNSNLKALPTETITRLEKAQKRDNAINNTMLALGVGALGYGAKRKWVR